jgi:hypothetical protein
VGASPRTLKALHFSQCLGTIPVFNKKFGSANENGGFRKTTGRCRAFKVTGLHILRELV